MKSKISIKSLNYSGGTINDLDIIYTEYGQIAFNQEYVFLESKDESIFKAIKIKLLDSSDDIFYRIRKTCIGTSYLEKLKKQIITDNSMQCLFFRKYDIWHYPPRNPNDFKK